MTISIVIPTIWRPSLRHAIISCLAQSVQPAEIIIVADKISDRAEAQVIAEFGDKVKVLNNHGSKGGAGARNLGWRQATSRFIAFLDDDDVFTSDKVQVLLTFLSDNPDVNAIAHGYFNYYEEIGLAMPAGLYDRKVDLDSLLTARCPASTSVAVFSRRALAAVEGFNENLTSYQDLELWLRISEIFSVAYIAQPLTYFFQHRGPRKTQNFRERIGNISAVATTAEAIAIRKRRNFSRTRFGNALKKGAIVAQISNDLLSGRRNWQAVCLLTSLDLSLTFKFGIANIIGPRIYRRYFFRTAIDAKPIDDLMSLDQL